MSKVLITGAGGFVGRYLVEEYAKKGWEIRAVVRSLDRSDLIRSKVAEIVEVRDISDMLNWMPLVQDCSVVVHLAARAHQVWEAPEEGSDAFYRVNVIATANLAQAAANANVQRFVFVSSSGVMGAESLKPWSEEDIPDPKSAYAKSKLMAEQEVKAAALRGGMEYVILRPALVYGPGNPGNLARLIKLVATGVPLPFKGITSKRSLINVHYLVEILVAASTLRIVTNRTYLAADGLDLTLMEIIQAFASGLAVPARIFHCPTHLLNLIARATGKLPELRKLTSSFQINAHKLQCDFGLKPFSGVKTALEIAAQESISKD